MGYFCAMAKTLLKTINSPKDLKGLLPDKLPQLATELRDFIIESVSVKPGHLGASLGTVELTIALHYFFNTPNDKLIWDVGHQAYGHKILTGRREKFDTNRELHGLSGFPKRAESDYDSFGTGHSSTSISAALGMAISAELQNKNQEHIAIIGDAGIASGMAFEALNHAGAEETNIWVILNDNGMGIDPSVGALNHYFQNIKTKGTPPQNNIFEALNFTYKGPVNGHDFQLLFKSLEQLKSVKGPKLLHIETTKGKGLQAAEKDRVGYHAPGKFDKHTGALLKGNTADLPPKYQDVFGKTLVELAKQNKKIIGITPAMPTGSSLKYMMRIFPERTFDVGISEQHAVTFAAGMAIEGNIVYCTIYSTFLQRAYDQIIHDVALQNIPVVFCVDRAGLVGHDGPTHHGVFDLAYLRCIPNLQIAAPSDEIQLRNLLYTVSKGINHPIAIRYPRGRGIHKQWRNSFKSLKIGQGHCFKKGNSIAVLSLGSIKHKVSAAIAKLDQKEEVAHYDLIFLKPLDKPLLTAVFQHFKTIITVEDGSKTGGFGDAVLEFAQEVNYKGTITKLGVPDKFMPQGSIAELQEIAGISAAKIETALKHELRRLEV